MFNGEATINGSILATLCKSIWAGNKNKSIINAKSCTNLINSYVAIRFLWNTLIDLFRQKRFYNRETNSATFCVIQQMSFVPPFPSMSLKWSTLFLTQSSQRQSWKRGGISANGNILIPLMVSVV